MYPLLCLSYLYVVFVRENAMIEKRRFSRILYQAPATLSQGDKQLSTCIQDLSLHGLLLWSEDEPDLDTHALVDVVFSLPESDVTISSAQKSSASKSGSFEWRSAILILKALRTYVA